MIHEWKSNYEYICRLSISYSVIWSEVWCEIARSSQERSIVVLIINHQSPGGYEGWMSYHAQFLNFRPDFWRSREVPGKRELRSNGWIQTNSISIDPNKRGYWRHTNNIEKTGHAKAETKLDPDVPRSRKTYHLMEKKGGGGGYQHTSEIRLNDYKR